ncbi:PA14 domain-containing protein, partial [Kitasatospora herbaricolor]|uniref:PA14 domain-containing protein n=1 Tax=Kitasatospora herbaricolor TaxID=68217 RepID=UPI0036DBA4F0
MLSTTDPQGHVSTRIYDKLDRATDTYGPAPANCFKADRTPTTCGIKPAHTHTSYDGGLQGLAASFWDNKYLTGAPKAYQLGVSPDGRVTGVWEGSDTPSPDVTSDAYSARLTGTVTFPTTGTYSFKTKADDTARLYVNNLQLINYTYSNGEYWSGAGVVTAKAGDVLPIRLDYIDVAGHSQLQLYWSTDGTTYTLVPATALAPNYGLATQQTVDDSAPAGVAGVTNAQVPSSNTTTDYGTSPWLGQVNATTIDSAGLNLRTESAYEPAGTGYLRLTGQRPPAAVATGLPAATAGTTSTYYGDAEPYGTALGITSPVCGLPIDTPQYGMLKTSTGPKPAVGSAIAVNFIYDRLGRVVATKTTGDADWSCATYDSRGRVTKATTAATSAGAPARTVTSSFSVNGDPGYTTVADSAGTITTRTDLLGQQLEYTDVWGTKTTT